MATYVVLMGGPGAGKGTQARKLEESLGLPQVSTGDLFRENFKKETELGKMAQKYMDAGELVPDEVTVGMVRQRLRRPDTADGAIFDGFPRTIAQAEALEDLLAEKSQHVAVVPYIHVDKEILLKRLSGRWTCPICGRVYHVIFNPPQEEGVCDVDGGQLYQRDDDSEETQRRRIEVYFEQTAPLLDYYRQKDLLAEIDGEQSIDEVYQDLLEVIQGAS
jgi:adenylate kinase